MPSTNREPGGYGMQRVVHERRRTAPPRRELTLRKAVEMAGLKIEGVEHEILPKVWVHVAALKGTRQLAFDAWVDDGTRMKVVRREKMHLLAEAGIPYFRIKVKSPEETSILILKAMLKGGIR